MSQVRKMVCIVCPVGCHLEITDRGDGISVAGNACKRGEAYALAELTDPRRTLTTSVWVEGGEMPLASVRSREPLPKAIIPQALQALRRVRLNAPVSVGQVVLENALGTGIDIIATRNVGAAD